MGKKNIRKARNVFTETERHQIIQDLMSTRSTKVEIWKKYTGEEEEHGQILNWMRKLGYTRGIKIRSPNIVSNYISMRKIKMEKPVNNAITENQNFENLQLKKRITELERQLKDAELKAIAFSAMVDIAEKEFKIPIRKKYNTKP